MSGFKEHLKVILNPSIEEETIFPWPFFHSESMPDLARSFFS